MLVCIYACSIHVYLCANSYSFLQIGKSQWPKFCITMAQTHQCIAQYGPNLNHFTPGQANFMMKIKMIQISLDHHHINLIILHHSSNCSLNEERGFTSVNLFLIPYPLVQTFFSEEEKVI